MNRSEQKEALTEIIDMTLTTIKNLEENRGWLEANVESTIELFNSLEAIGGLASISEDDMISEIVDGFFEHELEEVYDLASNFEIEMDDYYNELSESRQVKHEECYVMLREVVEWLSPEFSNYESIDEAIESLENAVTELKQMKK